MKSKDNLKELGTPIDPESLVDFHIRTSWHVISRMYNQYAQKFGITMSMGFILLVIHEENGTNTTKIGPMMGMESNSLSRIIKAMEDKGLVYKERDENDKRKVSICLTEKGKQGRATAWEAVETFNKEVFKNIPPKKLMVFMEVMDQIGQAVEQMKENWELD